MVLTIFPILPALADPAYPVISFFELRHLQSNSEVFIIFAMAQPVNSSSPVLIHAANALNAFTLVDLFDDALADLLCVNTYTHGTSPRNYYSIVTQGANPNRGGSASVGEGAFHRMVGHERPEEEGWDSRNKFYVFRDDCRISEAPKCLGKPLGSLVKKGMPRVYATISTIGELYNPDQESRLKKALAGVGGFFLSTFSPSLKFRFLPEQVESGFFKDDPTFMGGTMAAYSEQVIAPEHIGLYGTLAQCGKGSLLGRIQANPARFAIGLIKLIITVALTALMIYGMVASPLCLKIVGGILLFEAAIFIGRLVVPLILGAKESPALNPQEASK